MIVATKYCDGVIAGSARSTSAIRTGIPAQRKSNDTCEAKGTGADSPWLAEAGAPLERWRKDLKTLTVELKQPRVIDLVPIDFVSGEPVEREGKPAKRLRGQLITLRRRLTIRLRLGDLVIDRYEVVASRMARRASSHSRRTLGFVYGRENEF